jgi:hypothetical protein
LADENAYRGPGWYKYCIGKGLGYVFLVISLLLSQHYNRCEAQESTDLEEISITIFIRQIGTAEIPAYIQGQVLYLPVVNVFSFLRIQAIPTPGYDSVSGFFINQQSPYLIDRVNNKIYYHDKVYDLNQGDLIRTENNLYLKTNYFGEIFGLDCNFTYNSLSVTLSTKFELPVIREMRQAMMRANLSRLRGNIKPDTVIKRNFPIFHFGAADWAISASERVKNYSDLRVNLALGAILAGGEASLNLNYISNQPLNLSQQNYSWHFANNDLKAFRQIIVGKIPVQSNIAISAPVVGAQITNTPTTFQRSFCTYTLSDYTQPGWIVELYVNYVLVDYIIADAYGYFSFEVPLVYGNSLVKLRFYGPWGEEHTREQIIRIPFNFLPPHRFEYTLNTGIIENKQKSKYSKLNLNYGASRRLTLGGGAEYLSSLPGSRLMPYTNFSLRIATSLLVSAEYSFGLRFKGVLSYRLPKDLLIELYYTNLARNQKAINSNYLEERKAVISMPVNTRNFSSLIRLTLNQVVLPLTNYVSSELLISGALFGISTNLTTNAIFLNPDHPSIYTNLSLGFRLPGKIIFTPQVQYMISQARLLSGKVDLEKRIFHNGTLNLLFDRNFINNKYTVQFGFRYDFDALQANVSVRQSGDATTFLQFARGSLVNEGKGGNVKFSRNSSVGKGGIVVVPFLDLNGNGKHDRNEQKVLGLNVRVSGGRIEKNYRDSTIRVSELDPFTTYYIELDRNGFENVSWQIQKPIISITINPDQYRFVEVPVRILGEVSGMVFLEADTVKTGLGRIVVSFYRSDHSFVSKTMTEEDGFFTFLGLTTGSYYASLEQSQLEKINMTAAPDLFPFEIKLSTEGDQAGGIEFILHRK